MDGVVPTSLSATTVTMEECELLCTSADIKCGGYTFVAQNGACSLYGITSISDVRRCQQGYYTCTIVGGSSNPIYGSSSQSAAYDCFAKTEQFSYTDVSIHPVTRAKHADGTQYSSLLIPSGTFQQGKTYFILVTVTNGTH